MASHSELGVQWGESINVVEICNEIKILKSYSRSEGKRTQDFEGGVALESTSITKNCQIRLQ
jgi:hypothetical protein